MITLEKRSLGLIEYPVYKLPSDDITIEDGLVYIEGALIDDRNMPSDTLGKRRLISPQKDFFSLKKAVINHTGLLKQNHKYFIDYKGNIFIYQKTEFCKLKYIRIRRVDRKITHSVLWLEGINSPFKVPRPPNVGMSWAGVLFQKDVIPWILYEYSEDKKPDTRRKI